jgi:hypothetical protein
MSTASIGVDSVAMSSAAQDCSTSAWTWNDIPRHTSEHEADLAAQSQAVGAILPAETTCSSIAKTTTEAPQARAADVWSPSLRLQGFSRARHGFQSHLLAKNDISPNIHYNNGNISPVSGSVPGLWNWNDIPRQSIRWISRAQLVGQPDDPVLRADCASIWTWNDIPRDGSSLAMGSGHHTTLCLVALSIAKARTYVSAVNRPNWLTVGIG